MTHEAKFAMALFLGAAVAGFGLGFTVRDGLAHTSRDINVTRPEAVARSEHHGSRALVAICDDLADIMERYCGSQEVK